MYSTLAGAPGTVVIASTSAAFCSRDVASPQLTWRMAEVVYVNPVPDHLRCARCRRVLSEPVQSSCGERWHSDCLKEVIKYSVHTASYVVNATLLFREHAASGLRSSSGRVIVGCCHVFVVVRLQ